MSRFLRPARPADVPDIFRIRVSVRENLLTEPELAALGITRAAVADMLAEPCGWVAGDAGGTHGFALVDLEEGALFALFVDPAQEGRGHGRALLAAAEAALFARHETIWLETAADSRAAGVYRRAGWQPEGEAGPDWRLVKRRGPQLKPALG